jgi:hypothetical protein
MGRPFEGVFLMEQATFDIFRGTDDKDAVRIGSAAGLSNALQRMEEIAAAEPGRYFVCRQQGHAVLARIDTRGSNAKSAKSS